MLKSYLTIKYNMKFIFCKGMKLKDGLIPHCLSYKSNERENVKYPVFLKLVTAINKILV